VAYWKFDEASGTTAGNSVAGAPSGTHQGGVTISTNVPPTSYANPHSLNFNGTNAVVNVPNFGTFTAMSVACWVNRTGAGVGGRQSIVSYKETGGGFVLCANEGGGLEYSRIWLNQGGWQNKENTTALPLNTWTHLAATYNNTNLRLYVNGIEVTPAGAFTGNMTQPNAATGIGARNSLDQHWFPGLIDDVRIYDHALDITEVKVLSEGCYPPTALTAVYSTGQIVLNWTAPIGTAPVSGYTYRVKRATVAGGSPPGTYTTLGAPVVGTTYTDTTIVAGTPYYYVVTALSVAESGPSNETAPPVTALPNTGLFTDENGATTTFDIKFNQAAPAGGSLVTVSSSNTGEGVASSTFDTVPPSYTPTATGFTLLVPAGTSPTIPVIVTGQNDLVADPAHPYTVMVTAGGFGGYTIPSVQLINNDNDIPNITISRTSGLVTTESGGTDSFTVSLTTQPVGTVRMDMTSSLTTEGTVSPAFLLFDSTNWNAAQQVVLTGVDDLVIDFSIPYQITSVLSAANPADSAYNGMPVPVVSAVNRDNEAIPKAPSAWGGCGLLGLEIGLPLLFLRLRRRRA